MAADSIVASFHIGKSGIVTGIEGQKYLAYLVKEGLNSWDSHNILMNDAMKRIRVLNEDSLSYLKRLKNESIDCIYFDPMFEESILESDGIKALGHFAIHEDLQEEEVEEALRVAKPRVVLKDHYKSTRFKKFCFQVHQRKTA